MKERSAKSLLLSVQAGDMPSEMVAEVVVHIEEDGTQLRSARPKRARLSILRAARSVEPRAP